MNRWVIAAAAAAIVLIAGAIWWFAFRSDDTETVEVNRGSIDVTIQTIGRVQSTGTSTVRTQVAGEVHIVAVSPGDTVVAGDILVQLVVDPLERAVTNATRQLEDAEFALQLAQREAADNPDDENRTLAVIQAAQRVENAEVSLADAEQGLLNAYILAPRAGIILETPVREGDLINRTQPVAMLSAREDLEVIANVDELDLVNVQPDAEVRLRLDAFPDREMTGHVVSTAPAAREQGGATVFATTIAIDLPDDIDIRPGMNTDVTIITESRDNVLLIPQRAIRSVGNRAFVQLVVNGEAEEREIILGYRSAGSAEVVSGLEEGDIVQLP
jgi:membrane fusion protein, multidrug efflux system